MDSVCGWYSALQMTQGLYNFKVPCGEMPLQMPLLSSVLNSLDLETAEALTTAPATNCDLPYPFTPVYACTSVTFSVEYM